ncbi:MAG TPA: TIGR04076 family protein [Thermodesulfobacteriota bacterium]|nr:TIGR04076 family protein [Thermodesulfobacteriota bacterium]
MAKDPKIILRIASVKGTCAAHHRVGQEFDLSKPFTVGINEEGTALCPSAFYAAFPSYRTLRFGGELPWEEDKDTAHIACPDPANPLIIELRRIRE